MLSQTTIEHLNPLIEAMNKNAMVRLTVEPDGTQIDGLIARFESLEEAQPGPDGTMVADLNDDTRLVLDLDMVRLGDIRSVEVGA